MCVFHVMQAGLAFSQKAQYIHVCRWFDQVTISMHVMTST